MSRYWGGVGRGRGRRGSSTGESVGYAMTQMGQLLAQYAMMKQYTKGTMTPEQKEAAMIKAKDIELAANNITNLQDRGGDIAEIGNATDRWGALGGDAGKGGMQLDGGNPFGIKSTERMNELSRSREYETNMGRFLASKGLDSKLSPTEIEDTLVTRAGKMESKKESARINAKVAGIPKIAAAKDNMRIKYAEMIGLDAKQTQRFRGTGEIPKEVMDEAWLLKYSKDLLKGMEETLYNVNSEISTTQMALQSDPKNSKLKADLFDYEAAKDKLIREEFEAVPGGQYAKEKMIELGIWEKFNTDKGDSTDYQQQWNVLDEKEKAILQNRNTGQQALNPDFGT